MDDEEEEEEEEDWLNDDESLSKDSTTFKFDLPSTRLDFVAKKGFGISRK